MTRAEIITRIEKCCEAQALRPSTVCQMATGNSKIYNSLTTGKPGPGIDTINTLLDWIEERMSQDAAA
jgi:hypothetical protein